MRIKRIVFAFVAVALLAAPLFGAITATTLAAAVSTTSETTFQVASATGFVAGYTAIVDREAVTILSVNTTFIKVFRGAGGTRAATHVSGAAIYAGPSNEVSTELKTYFGRVTLNGASPALGTVTGLYPAYNSTGSFACTGTIQGTAATTVQIAVSILTTSSFKFTATNAATDVVVYHCVGY